MSIQNVSVLSQIFRPFVMAVARSNVTVACALAGLKDSAKHPAAANSHMSLPTKVFRERAAQPSQALLLNEENASRSVKHFSNFTQEVVSISLSIGEAMRAKNALPSL